MVTDFDFGFMRDRRTIGAVRSGAEREEVSGARTSVWILALVERRAPLLGLPFAQDVVASRQETVMNTALARPVNTFLL
jgi:hypothetical protein